MRAFIETGDNFYKKEALQGLEKIAKYYALSARKTKPKIDIKTALYDFILNNKGYVDTIANLSNSLC